MFSDFFRVFFNSAEFIGTVAFAASGAIMAIDRELDLFGVIFLGIIAAVGGGIMRDVLLGSFPPTAFVNSIYVLTAFLTSVVVFVCARFMGKRYWDSLVILDRVVNWLDAIGLGIFSVVGTQTAIAKGFVDNAFLCVVMGMMTGVGGGILRDLLSQTIPAVLKKRIYAVASIVGSLLYLWMIRAGVGGPASMLTGMAVTVAIRLLSTHYMWDLPKVPHP